MVGLIELARRWRVDYFQIVFRISYRLSLGFIVGVDNYFGIETNTAFSLVSETEICEKQEKKFVPLRCYSQTSFELEREMLAWLGPACRRPWTEGVNYKLAVGWLSDGNFSEGVIFLFSKRIVWNFIDFNRSTFVRKSDLHFVLLYSTNLYTWTVSVIAKTDSWKCDGE